MPVWLRAVLRWGRQHPGIVALLVALGSLVGYWQLQPSRPPTTRPIPATAQPFTGTLPAQVSLESALATVQRENEHLKQILAEQQRTLARLERDQQTRQQDAAAQARQLEATLQQALATADLARRPPPAPASATAPVRPPAPLKPPPVLRILRPAKEPAAVPVPMAPTVPAPPWVQLPAGSFVRGRLLTGLFATTHAGGALPALFVVREAFTGPNQTAIPLQGCLALGKAQADLASLRAIVQLTTLACVWPDGRTFEQPVAGYVTGRDGTLGLPGRLEQRAGAYLGRTFLASLVAGAAEAFAAAERTVHITPLGGSQSAITGDTGKYAAFSALATASARVADFYLAQAEQLLPVVWVASGQDVQLVLQQGVTLEGLPATAALPRLRGLGASGFD
jgi:conjugal transfer pilus assembly protein TraB